MTIFGNDRDVVPKGKSRLVKATLSNLQIRFMNIQIN